MNVDKYLTRWHAAGIISEEQAEAIRRFERERPSASWVIYGISGLGIVVLMSGFLSVVAANWQEISASAKLILYFIILSLLGFGIIRRAHTPGLVRESLVSVFGLALLAGIGLIGQTFHLTGNGYDALFLWVALITPLTIRCENRLLPNVWCAGLIGAISFWLVSDHGERVVISRAAMLLALPYIFLGLGYALEHLLSRQFCQSLRIWSYATILGLYGSFASVAWSNAHALSKSELLNVSPWYAVMGGVIAALLILMRKYRPGQLLTAALLGFIASSLIWIVPPLSMQMAEKHDILGCALFILTWSFAAAVAALIPRKRLFDLATFVIGVRFVVVYFEVFGSLAATGLGLIFSGSIILGIAYAWHRYRSRMVSLLQERA